MNRVLLFPTLFLLLLGGIGFFSTRGEAKRPSNSLVFCNAGEVNTLDPGRMSWQNDIRTAMGLWEGLAAYDPKTLEPIPGAATWEMSPDGRIYTFHLRKQAKWSNGDPVVAGDFVFAWKRVLTPATAADYSNFLFYIKGAEAYFNAIDKGKPADFSSVGIRTPDDQTLVVELENPCGYFLDLVAFPVYYPLHEKSMARFKAPDGTYRPEWTHPPDLITNGPFQLEEWEFKRYIKLVPNPHYWDRAQVTTDAIIIKAMEDHRGALVALEQRQVDALTFVPPGFGDLILQQRDEKKRNDVQYRSVFGTYYYLFNCQRKPFDDKRVRKALSLAIDRTKITDKVLRMGQIPCTLFVAPDAIPYYKSPMGLEMNIDEAKKLLAEAGFPDGKGFPETEILYNKEAIHEKVAQAIGQMWQQNLGVRVTYRGLELGGFRNERKQRNFAIARGGWYGDYGDPTTWLDLAKTGDGNNDGQFSNKDYDAILAKAAREPDRDKRLALLTEAERILVEDEFPFVPLYQYADGFMFDPNRVSGLDLNVRLMTQFKYVSKK